MSETKVNLSFEHDGVVARLNLAAPKANIIDADMMESIEHAIDALKRRRGLHAIVLGAEGPHFSFGASIEEHLPESIGRVLPRLHGVLRDLLGLPAPTIAAVRGQCLGGGLEVALGCDLVVAEQSAQFGLPEVKLGVFAPAATLLLPLRIGGGAATRLLLTGASCGGTEAAQCGLVDELVPDGELETGVQAFVERHFLPRSAVGLRHAAMASRHLRQRCLVDELPTIENRYLDDLMAEPDAIEGIRAFLQKRAPQWTETVS